MITFQMLYPWLIILIRIIFILGAAFILSAILGKLIPRLRASTVNAMRQHSENSNPLEMEKRAATISGILQKTATFLIWGVALMMSLREIGFDIAPILAGAGVVGLAVGFGAQNLVRDVISGLMMLVENQIRVNDVAVINGTGGLVEEINLRTTVLRSLDGVVHVFPNGTITSLSNMTLEYSFYVFDLRVSYFEDTDRIAEVVQSIADEMMQEEKYKPLILAPLEVLGVDQLGESTVILKARIKTLPIQQWNVGREMNRRIKKVFLKEGIQIPFPQRAFSINSPQLPLSFKLQDGTREELKDLVRDVLREHGLNAHARPLNS